MLKILCCVKQVPDVDQMRMDPETGNLIRAGVPAILNPLDANALSAAVKVKEAYGGEITLITMGPPPRKPRCASASPSARTRRSSSPTARLATPTRWPPAIPSPPPRSWRATMT